MERAGDWIAQRVYQYLQGRDDLVLQTAAVDATDKEGMRRLLHGLEHHVGGCMLMTVLLNDRTFTAHTQETFESTFPAKVQAFRVLEEILDINNLEFLVAFSSISGMFGNPGQTNYSA